MSIIAIYSAKGGVGKTTIAVNLAWASATLSSRRTLLWDLDGQGAASFILARDRRPGRPAREVIERALPADELILPTAVPNLDLLPADVSLRTLDAVFADGGARKRLRRIAETLLPRYDRIVVDCPPGLGATAEQVIRGASLMVVPMTPSVLSTRMVDELRGHLAGRRKPGPPLLPVFNMVDRRRAGHRAALAALPDVAAVPMASAVEQMAERGAPLGDYAGRTAAAKAIAALWVRIERELARAR